MSLGEGGTAITLAPAAAVTYAEDVVRGGWPEAEAAILTDVVSAISYARRVLNTRWAEAEPLIATGPELARHYARAWQGIPVRHETIPSRKASP